MSDERHDKGRELAGLIEKNIACAQEVKVEYVTQSYPLATWMMVVAALRGCTRSAVRPSRTQAERAYVVKRVLQALTDAHIAVTSGTGYDPAKYSSTYSEAAQLIQRLDAELEVAESHTPSAIRFTPVEIDLMVDKYIERTAPFQCPPDTHGFIREAVQAILRRADRTKEE